VGLNLPIVPQGYQPDDSPTVRYAVEEGLIRSVAPKDERPRVEGKVLGSFLPLFSDELDRFELLEASLCNSDGGQSCLNRGEGLV
jgi:hypothetical protein